MKKQIYIVDHIGIHSGMHYYNGSFKNYLEEIEDLNVKILSNYNDEGKTFFINFYKGNKFLGLLSFVINYFKILIKVIVSRKSHFIFLSYGTIIDSILMTISIFSKRVLIDVHEVFALQLKNKLIFKIISFEYKYVLQTVIYHSERSEDLLNEIGYNKKRIYVPHFKFQFSKTFKIEKIGDDILQGISKEKINILFFGYANFEKGIDLLLQATNLLYDKTISAKLNIIIAGKDLDGTINNVETKSDTSIVRILRYINDDELIFLFSNVDYIILPYRKTSQSGILEMAFYFNKPILAARIKYFENILSQFPSFGVLMQLSDQSVADTLTHVVKSHDSEKNIYFSQEDLSKYNEKEKVNKFLEKIRDIIYPALTSKI